MNLKRSLLSGNTETTGDEMISQCMRDVMADDRAVVVPSDAVP